MLVADFDEMDDQLKEIDEKVKDEIITEVKDIVDDEDGAAY